MGVFCDTSNVGRVVNSSGGAEELIVLAFDNRGRSCYRVFWGVFDSRLEAERAVGTVPAGVLARDSAPVPTEKARLVYFESLAVTQYLVDRKGRQALNQLLVLLARRYTMNDSLNKIIGLDYQEFQIAWEADLSRYRPTTREAR